MNKIISILILLNAISISYQVDCNSYNDDTCGGHNSDYKLQCHIFAPNQCREVEVDDGCEIDNSNNCGVKNDETLPEGEACYAPEIKNPAYKCKRITIDNYCEINSSGYCDKKSEGLPTDFIEDNHICAINTEKTSCTKRNKVCSDQVNTNCEGFTFLLNANQKCAKIYDNDVCQVITVDNYCEINSSGYCDKKSADLPSDFNDANHICDFNTAKTSCTKRNKVCSDQVNTNCGGFTIATTNQKCAKIYDNDVCQVITVDNYCEINSSGYCDKKSGDLPTDFSDATDFCDFNTAKTSCTKRNKVCSDQVNTNCGGFTIATTNQKCAKIYDNDVCQVITVDNYCEINSSGYCDKKSGDLPTDFSDATDFCDFNTAKTSCTKRNKVCSDQVNTNCGGFTIATTNQKCAKIYDNAVCQVITVDNYCEINSSGYCDKKSGDLPSDFNDANHICDFNTAKTSCTKRNKVCQDQTPSNCGGFTIATTNQKCAKIYDNAVCQVITVDNYCEINSSGYCDKKSADLPSDFNDANHICDFNTEKTTCTKRNKICSEYTDDNCGSIPETNNLQCANILGLCRNVELDDYCHVNQGECVKKADSELTENEICDFKNSNTECKKREKKCEDLDDNACENYTPIAKLCFKVEGNNCKEVETDNSCKINSSLKCVPIGSLGKHETCILDNGRCYKKKTGGASLLCLKLFSLLLLFFIY